MAFDINNFVIDRTLRGTMFKGNGDYAWSITQITKPSINVTTETSEVVDALGAKIVEFDRAKNAEFSAENSLFDLGLYASQQGTEKAHTFSAVPACEEVTLTTTATSLAHEAVAGSLKVYEISSKGVIGAEIVATNYTAATSDGKTTLAIDAGSKDAIVFYDYEAADDVVAVNVNAEDFPKVGRFVLEVLGCDVCDPSELIYAKVVFPKAKLNANVDYTFTSDGTHPFTIKVLQDYCSKEKKLFSIVIPKTEG